MILIAINIRAIIAINIQMMFCSIKNCTVLFFLNVIYMLLSCGANSQIILCNRFDLLTLMNSVYCMACLDTLAQELYKCDIIHLPLMLCCVSLFFHLLCTALTPTIIGCLWLGTQRVLFCFSLLCDKFVLRMFLQDPSSQASSPCIWFNICMI